MAHEGRDKDRGGPSRTALATAYARALHQVADDPRILVDPVVGRLIGFSAHEPADEPAAGTGPAGDRPFAGAADRPRRMFFAARARYAEDRIAALAARGVRQVVVLGAGLDTFACRNPHPGLRVFEVDRPATQEWKRDRLAEAGIEVPESLTFVPVDFETDALAERLAAAGFLRAEPALFAWLGVVFYLTAEAVQSTLGYIAGQAGPSEVVFDYLQPPDSEPERQRLRERAARVAAAGEPFFSYFTPAAVAARLDGLGFTPFEDLSAAQLVDGYAGGSADFQSRTPDALRASRILRAGLRPAPGPVSRPARRPSNI